MERHASINSADTAIADRESLFRGPSSYQSRGQYYDVLNHFINAPIVQRTARFKRIGDKRGWGQPETLTGREIDRVFFMRLEHPIWECLARISELVKDGCEFVSYRKNPAPGGLVSYLLVSYPTNSELENNRTARLLRKQPRQKPLPREVQPFRHPVVRHAVELSPVFEHRVKTDGMGRPIPEKPVIESDLPLFCGVRQP